MKSRTMPKFVLRLPQEMKDWLAAEAAQNASSQNSEIIRAIHERMERVISKLEGK